MKKKVIPLLLAAVMVVGTFTGCGKDYNAGDYAKAYLDNMYHDKSKALKSKFGFSKEECENIRNTQIESEISTLQKNLADDQKLSDDTYKKYQAVFDKMYDAAKYSIDKVQKSDDGYYLVTYTYQKANLCDECVNKTYTDLTQVDTKDMSYDKAFELLADNLEDYCDNGKIKYSKKETATFYVKQSKDAFRISENDLKKIELNLYDISKEDKSSEENTEGTENK